MTNITKTITIEGKRDWTGPLENYLAHADCVDHWCGGGEVEKRTRGEWRVLPIPEFLAAASYRIKTREPKPGEVWYCSETEVALLITHEKRYAELESGTVFADYTGCVYAAPDVKAYYAQELYKELLDNDYEDADKLMRVVKKLVDSG